MKALLIYLLQVIVASGILYAYYHFFLRNREFHQYNRFYLLSAVVISLLVPFLQIPVYFSGSDAASSPVLRGLQTIPWSSEGEEFVVSGAASSPFSVWDLLPWLYALVGGWLTMRLLVSFIQIHRLLKRHRVEKLEGIHFVNTEEPGTPFTFFRWLFWDKKIALESESGKQIFRHEIFHIQQRHSWDVLGMEIVRTILWMNPFFHLIKKELRAIHEFLADEFAVREQEKWAYAEFLLMQALQSRHRLVNPFFHSQIKRRIAMITNSQKTSHRYLRKVLALPLAVLVLGLVAFKVKSRPAEPASTHPPFLENVESAPSMKLNNGVMDFDTTPPKAKNVVLEPVREKNVELKPVSEKEKQDVTKIRIRGEADPLFIINGEIVKPSERIKLDTLSPTRIKSINVLKGETATNLYGEKGTNGVVSITTKEHETADLKEVVLEGKPTKNYLVSRKGEPAREVQLQEVPAKKYRVSRSEEPLQEIVVEGRATLVADKIELREARKTDELNEVVVVGYSKNNSRQEPLFDQVEQNPQPKGGEAAWRKHLEKNLDINIAVKNNAPLGRYTVKIRFIIEKDGSISQLAPLTMHGFGMEEEAMRVIKSGPGWEPAQQNGKVVRAYRTQPITFLVQKEETERPVLMLKEKASELSEQSASKGILYPNPANQQCTIQLNAEQAGPATIRIVTVAGESTDVQKNINLVKGNNTISVATNTLKAGTYFVQVLMQGNKGLTYKLIKN